MKRTRHTMISLGIGVLVAATANAATANAATANAATANAATPGAAPVAPAPNGSPAAKADKPAAKPEAAAKSGEPGRVKVDDFEAGLRDWTAFRFAPEAGFGPDPGARVAVTDKPSQVKSGRGSLYYIYNVAPRSISLLGMQRPLRLNGVRSVRFSIRCDTATMMGFALREEGLVRYQAFFYCPANRWQQVAISLDELSPATDTPDPNGRLDPEKIQGMYLADAAALFAEAIGAPEGPRILWLDDIEYSPQAAALGGATASAAAAKPAGTLDSFESSLIRWVPLRVEVGGRLKIALADTPLALSGEAAPGGGRQSLKASYKREKGRIAAWLRPLEERDVKAATAINLSLKTAGDGLFVLAATERDGSRYQQLIQMKSADGWKKLSYPLSGLKLADDSRDENNRLDVGQLRDIALADIGGLLSGDGRDNTLWLDEVAFSSGK